jgi:predicted XRE-type DNA-binding protein
MGRASLTCNEAADTSVVSATCFHLDMCRQEEMGHATKAEMEVFGALLRAARRRAGLSQMQLEHRSGVDQSVISRLERGKAVHVPIDRIVALAAAMPAAFPLGRCPHPHMCAFNTERMSDPQDWLRD